MNSGSIIKTPEQLSGGKKREQGGWDSAGCGGGGRRGRSSGSGSKWRQKTESTLPISVAGKRRRRDSVAADAATPSSITPAWKQAARPRPVPPRPSQPPLSVS